LYIVASKSFEYSFIVFTIMVKEYKSDLIEVSV
jgi:hypothetical protein